MAQARLFTLYRYKSIYLPTKFSHSSGISLFSCIPHGDKGWLIFRKEPKEGDPTTSIFHNFALVTYR